jgi:hypothetical protein
MRAPWVVEEMATADLDDKRLNERLRVILSRLAARPTASIPAACGGFAEMTAAYRFFDNDKVGFDGVLRPHIDRTHARVADQEVVLLVPDTTEIDVTRPEQQVRGAGPLDGARRRGVFLHLMHAFTPDGTPLGTVQAIPRARDDDKLPVAAQSSRRRAATPIAEKESFRWLLSMREARERAGGWPRTQVVYVADSEADIYDVIATGMEEPRTAPPIGSCAPVRTVPWWTTWRAPSAWTTSARRPWHRRRATARPLRSAAAGRSWPATIAAAVSRGSRARRPSRSAPSGSRSAPPSGRSGPPPT